MPYKLAEINARIKENPKQFLADCGAEYDAKVANAADKICANLKYSPIVLLSGPSGSGKTTTAMKIRDELKRRGVGSHSIQLDDYFFTVDPRTAPRTPEGDIDYESPLCVDMELLNEHFKMLTKGERIFVPKYLFSRQVRLTKPSQTLKLKKDEIVIFEGIHALNDGIAGANPEALGLYISARSDVTNGGGVVFKGTWMRLVRRAARDNLYRGSPPEQTLAMWANIRRGEKLYISPFKQKAKVILDSSLPYEVSVMKNVISGLFTSISDDNERSEELKRILPAFEKFEGIDPTLVPAESLLREFIGGGIYEY